MKRRNKSLRSDRVIATLEKLHERILARFPDAGLVAVCADLVETAHASAREAAALARPAYAWRAAAILLLLLGIATQVAAMRFLRVEGDMTTTEVLQSLEATVNLVILFGGAVWFMLTVEERIKRRRVLDALHGLRALAHVIDMHQLTKDPTFIFDVRETAASPQRLMNRFELNRYLDYCSEMLAVIGKLAALYGERVRDGVVIDAVNDIEALTTSLGRKIWQKITVLGVLDETPQQMAA